MIARERATAVRIHLPWALVTGAVWGVSYLIPFETSFRFCAFLRLTDYPCMFCGLTRSFGALSQGAWLFALINAPIALLLYFGTIAVFFWNLIPLITGRKMVPAWWTRIRGNPWLWAGVTALILANWGYRLSQGLR